MWNHVQEAKQRADVAVLRATEYLASKITYITDPFQMAILTYALQVSHHKDVDTAYNRLRPMGYQHANSMLLPVLYVLEPCCYLVLVPCWWPHTQHLQLALGEVLARYSNGCKHWQRNSLLTDRATAMSKTLWMSCMFPKYGMFVFFLLSIIINYYFY